MHRLVQLVSAFVLVALGCANTNSLSADEFSKQAEKICTEQIEAIVDLGPVDAGDPDAAAGSVDQVAEIQSRALDELRALDPPENLADDVDAWLEGVGETLAQQQKLADAIRAGNQEAVAAANMTGTEVAAKADAAADDLGLTQCTGEVTVGAPESTQPTTATTMAL